MDEVRLRPIRVMPCLRRNVFGFVSISCFFLILVIIFYPGTKEYRLHAKLPAELPAELRAELRAELPAGELTRLSWASFSDHKLNETFLFISAYYDSRSTVPGRPAVAIIAYALEIIAKPNLTCSFVYSDTTTKCLRGIYVRQEIFNCFYDQSQKDKPKKRIAQFLLCPVDDGNIPEAVQLSVTTDCKENSLSELILVENYQKRNLSFSKNIGVCLQGSVRKEGITDLKHKLDNFINMCMFMGAEFVTIYASPDEVQEDVIQYLLTNYSHIVNLIEWKIFQSHDYHGQNGVMHDCIYRHMYDTNYLVMMDMDEMIIPFKQLNWPDMLNALEKKRGNNAGYSFMNRFYLDSSFDYPDLLKCKNAEVVSPYMTHLSESQCRYNHGDRSKYIIVPKLVVHAAVHCLCKVISRDQLFPVASGFAVSAHYRYQIDKERCGKSKIVNKYENLKELLSNYTAAFCKVRS